MSTTSVTPDQSGGLASAVPSSTPSNYVEQSSQNPAPAVAAAPADPGPANGPSRLNTVLARIVGTVEPRASQPSVSSGGDVSTNEDADNTGQRPRWQSVLGKVINAATTGLAGIPAGGRPSFIGGLGEGARAEQQDQATQNALKFKDFDTQVRLAQLTHQEKVWQNEDQDRIDQLDQSAKDQVKSMGDKYGQTYDFVSNDDNGQAALTHMGMKQLQDGSISLPEGVIAAPHGWYIPNKSSQEQSKANTQHFNDQSQFFGVPGTGGQPVNPKAYFAFNNQLLHGQNPDGSFMHSDQIKSLTTTAQQRLDEYKDKPNSDPTIVAEAQRHIDDLTNLAEKAATREANPVQTPKQKADVANENARTNRINNPIVKPQKIDSTSVVAFDPDAPGLNGTKGANVVLPKAQADAKGLASYKANPEKLNGLIAGVNDVQTKINALADASADMSEVDPSVSATMSGSGIGLEWHGVGLGSMADIANSQGRVLANKGMNDATRNYIVALAGAHEAITQLPRLQTMGASSRVTEKQMEQAAKMLPTPGDDTDMANAKLHGLQNTIDPIRKQIPSMPGASLVPSFRENNGSNWNRTQRLQQAPTGKAPTKAAGAFNYADTM